MRLLKAVCISWLSAQFPQNQPSPPVTQWRYRYVRDVAAEICETVTSARPLRYCDVLDLDQKIRGFPVHPSAVTKVPEKDDLEPNSEFSNVFHLIINWYKEVSLLHTHRNFFAKAVMDFPENPMRSPFAASFLATYRSASAVIRFYCENVHAVYLTTLRFWHAWSVFFSSAVRPRVYCAKSPSHIILRLYLAQLPLWVRRSALRLRHLSSWKMRSTCSRSLVTTKWRSMVLCVNALNIIE